MNNKEKDKRREKSKTEYTIRRATICWGFCKRADCSQALKDEMQRAQKLRSRSGSPETIFYMDMASLPFFSRRAANANKTSNTKKRVETIDLTGDDPEVVVKTEPKDDDDSSVTGPATQSKTIIKKLIDKKCPICLNNIHHDNAASTDCGHIFCMTCLQSALRFKKQCPTCRKQLFNIGYHRIYI